MKSVLVSKDFFSRAAFAVAALSILLSGPFFDTPSHSACGAQPAAGPSAAFPAPELPPPPASLPPPTQPAPGISQKGIPESIRKDFEALFATIDAREYSEFDGVFDRAAAVIDAAPGSPEAFCAAAEVERVAKGGYGYSCEGAFRKYKKELSDGMDDISSDRGRKFVLAVMMASVHFTDDPDPAATEAAGRAALEKMASPREDDGFAALAAAVLSPYDKAACEGFLARYPRHAFEPFVSRDLIMHRYYVNRDSVVASRDLRELAKRCAAIRSPRGWPVSADIRVTLVTHLAATNDAAGAKEFLEALKKEAPSHPDIDALEKLVSAKK